MLHVLPISLRCVDGTRALASFFWVDSQTSTIVKFGDNNCAMGVDKKGWHWKSTMLLKMVAERAIPQQETMWIREHRHQ